MTNPSPGTPHDPENPSSASSSSDPTEASSQGPAFGASEHAGHDSFSEEEQSPFADDAPSGDPFSEKQLALEMAKEWVRQHQTAAMLGAFAVGAFVGALMRD